MKAWNGLPGSLLEHLELSVQDHLETDLLPLSSLELASPWLRTLLHVHARVTSPQHQARVDSPDGTVHRFASGPVVRDRWRPSITPLERTQPA